MGPEVGQQRVTEVAEGVGPVAQGRPGIGAEADELGSAFFELLQRTVEGGSLGRSPTGEGCREYVQDHPLFAFERTESDLFVLVALEGEVRGGLADFNHVFPPGAFGAA